MGEVVQMDLMGSSKGEGRSGADSLLVIGTSLRVPRINRMVCEFASAGLYFSFCDDNNILYNHQQVVTTCWCISFLTSMFHII